MHLQWNAGVFQLVQREHWSTEQACVVAAGVRLRLHAAKARRVLLKGIRRRGVGCRRRVSAAEWPDHLSLKSEKCLKTLWRAASDTIAVNQLLELVNAYHFLSSLTLSFARITPLIQNQQQC